MAKVHGHAGAYPDARAGRLFERFLLIVLAVMLLIGLMLGVGLASRNVWLMAVISALAVGAMLAGTRLSAHRLAAYRRGRQAYLRGADGEQVIGVLLEDLPDTWHVFHGLQLRAQQDIDHVVVGPGGVFCVSTKNMRGLFLAGRDGQLLYNNAPTDLAQRALKQTMQLRDRLTALMATDRLYVNAVLAVPWAYVDVTGRQGHVLVLHRDNLVATVESAPRRLTGEQVQAYVSALELLAASSRDLVRQAERARFPAPDAAVAAPVNDPTGAPPPRNGRDPS